MGLFDKFKKNNKNEKIENEKIEKINAPGWDAIDEEAKRIYPGQDNPKHYAAQLNGDLVVQIHLMV